MGAGETVVQPCRGVGRPTSQTVLELGRLRFQFSKTTRLWPIAGSGTVETALAETGRRLTTDFVAGAVGHALAARVTEADQLGEAWAARARGSRRSCPICRGRRSLPGQDGNVVRAGGEPLVLRHNVAVYRAIPDLGPTRPTRSAARFESSS